MSVPRKSALGRIVTAFIGAALTVFLYGSAHQAPVAAQDQIPQEEPGQVFADRAENGAVYTLLGDLKGFRPGDRVSVEGTRVEISFCMQGTTLQVTQITRR